jgi:hypothetical protein
MDMPDALECTTTRSMKAQCREKTSGRNALVIEEDAFIKENDYCPTSIDCVKGARPVIHYRLAIWSAIGNTLHLPIS